VIESNASRPLRLKAVSLDAMGLAHSIVLSGNDLEEMEAVIDAWWDREPARCPAGASSAVSDVSPVLLLPLVAGPRAFPSEVSM